jgi:hypothetical protein
VPFLFFISVLSVEMHVSRIGGGGGDAFANKVE